MSSDPILVWLHSDLRLDDNPALFAAAQTKRPVVPIFIFDESTNKKWKLGGASRWWLHHALEDLSSQFEELGSKLLIFLGNTEEVLAQLKSDYPDCALYFHRRYTQSEREQDAKIRELFSDREVKDFSGNLLYEPELIKTKQGNPYQVYTPYWNACLDYGQPAKPVAAPKNLISPSRWVKSTPLADLKLLPSIDWDGGMKSFWEPTVEGARKLFQKLREKKLDQYKEGRDLPAEDGTSKFSPYLHFGQLSIRRLWHELYTRPVKKAESKTQYLKELVWRDFAYHLIYHFPHTDLQPLREDFKRFPWSSEKKILRAWQKGQTGYPMVDAGMRQLWTTGWMHNRVRMVVASFLVKHLLLPWQEGALWFWDTLVDADLASNTMGWQWSAGCGADAAPYFRIFNPMTQSEKFDATGAYLREWVPEISKLEDKYIHAPWSAPADALAKAGIVLGKSYPKPIVDHKESRDRALKAFESISKGKKAS